MYPPKIMIYFGKKIVRMSGSSSFLSLAFLFLLFVGCVRGGNEARQVKMIDDSIRIQDSVQIQMILDSLSEEADSLKALLLEQEAKKEEN